VVGPNATTWGEKLNDVGNGVNCVAVADDSRRRDADFAGVRPALLSCLPTIRLRNSRRGHRMGIRLNRVGHIGIHVSDVDRSIDFYRKVLGLKVTGRWGPPDFGRPICFMRIADKHHDVVLFELAEDVKTAGIALVDSRVRTAPGLDHIAFEIDSREDWLLALDHVRACGVKIVSGPYVHGPEGGEKFVGGSGSHAFYFLDPDGNRLEIYCWMMRVTGPSLAAPQPDI
jgi:catechol 2,3-dioxygenase-like lactoylglutathione lyase family enzyme